MRDQDNRPTQRLANYLEERAEGRGPHHQTICPWKRNDIDRSRTSTRLPSCLRRSCIPDLRASRIEPVHKRGGLIYAQPYYVMHDWKPGRNAGRPLRPSDIAILKFMGGFRAMTLREQIEGRSNGNYFNAARVVQGSRLQRHRGHGGRGRHTAMRLHGASHQQPPTIRQPPEEPREAYAPRVIRAACAEVSGS